jgi:hypothetical protein
MLAPTPSIRDSLPAEFTIVAWMRIDIRGWNIPIAALYEAFTPRAGQIFFSSFWALVPIVLAPGAAALAWPRARGSAWDKSGLAVRPLAWLLILYVPLAYALWTFTFLGWDGPSLGSLALARLRETALTIPLALWVAFGGAATIGRWLDR